jgi:hypothetical protein
VDQRKKRKRKQMKTLPILEGYLDEFIPEKDILNLLSEDMIPLWENYMKNKTLTQIGFDNWGVHETDYNLFKGYVDVLYLKELEKDNA